PAPIRLQQGHHDGAVRRRTPVKGDVTAGSTAPSCPRSGMPRQGADCAWENEDVEQRVTSVAQQVETAVSTALGRVRSELAGADPLVRRSDGADFQPNVALATAKRVKARPAELAAELAQALQEADGIADVEVSG